MSFQVSIRGRDFVIPVLYVAGALLGSFIAGLAVGTFIWYVL